MACDGGNSRPAAELHEQVLLGEAKVILSDDSRLTVTVTIDDASSFGVVVPTMAARSARDVKDVE